MPTAQSGRTQRVREGSLYRHDDGRVIWFRLVNQKRNREYFEVAGNLDGLTSEDLSQVLCPGSFGCRQTTSWDNGFFREYEVYLE